MPATLMLFFLLVPPTQVSAPNPGFEDGAAGWSLPSLYAVDNTVAHTGSASLRVDRRDPANYELASARVSLRAGERYEFSAWVKTEGVKGDETGATLCIEWSGAQGWIGGAYPTGIKGDHDWTLVQGVTQPIPKEATECRVTVYLRKGCTGRAWFDDVLIAEYFPPPMTASLAKPRYRGQARAGDPSAVAEIRVAIARKQGGGLTLRDMRLRSALMDSAGKMVDGRTVTPTGHETAVSFPLAKLAPGRYIAAVALFARATGKVLGRQQFAVEILPADAPRPTVWIDDRGRTIVNGKPFFPLGMYDGGAETADIRTMAAAGLNCVMPYGSCAAPRAENKRRLDAAEAAGMKVILSVKDLYNDHVWRPADVTDVDAKTCEEVGAFRDHPALLAWYANDELPVSYMEQLVRKYRLVREADPNHLVWVVVYQVDDIPQYAPTTDVIGTDPYPVPSQPLSMAGDWARKTVAGMAGAGAVWMVPQAHDWSVYAKPEERKPTDRAPSLGDMRNMSLQCLAEGAMGLVYYSFFDLKRDPNGFDARWADMKRVVSEVRQLIPYVLSAEPAPDIGLHVTGAGAHARAWRLGGDLVIVAANGAKRGLATVHWRLPHNAKPELLFGDPVRLASTGAVLSPGQSVAVKVSMGS